LRRFEDATSEKDFMKLTSMLRNQYSTFKFYIILITFSYLLPSGQSYGEGCRGSTARRLDPSNCQQYFQCIAGVSYRAHCQPGTVFSKTTLKCEKSAQIPCSANKVTGHSLERQPCTVNGEIRPSEIACDKYLLCRVNYYVGMNCPFGLIFSNIKFRCLTPPDHCVTETEAGGGGTLKELELKKEENPYIGICDQKINETVPEPFDCSMYILCEEDRTNATQVQAAMSILECPNKTLFSATENKCLAPSAVYCGPRYRVLNLYGPDIQPPAQMGRSFGGRSSMSVIKGRSPEKPKYWIQPGKYRAIAKQVSNDTVVKPAQSKSPSSSSGGGGGIIATSINGFMVQKPLQMEVPTPIQTTTEDRAEDTTTGHGGMTEEDGEASEETTTVSSLPNGRTFGRKTNTAAQSGRTFNQAGNTTGVGRTVSMPGNAPAARSGRTFERSGNANTPNAQENSSTANESPKTNTVVVRMRKARNGNKTKKSGPVGPDASPGKNVEATDIKPSVGGKDFHHEPVVVNIIMGNSQPVPTVTHWHPILEHELVVHNTSNKSSKENRLAPPIPLNGDKSGNQAGSPGEKVASKVKPKDDDGRKEGVSTENEHSLESDEDEPFRFNKTGPRAPKRTSLLEDYHAVLNGKRFNSTAEDILYYGDDEYYVGDSNENETGIVLPRNPNRIESSLELTHHDSNGSPSASPKMKLPERPPPLEK